MSRRSIPFAEQDPLRHFDRSQLKKETTNAGTADNALKNYDFFISYYIYKIPESKRIHSLTGNDE